VDSFWSFPVVTNGEGVNIAVLDSGYNVLNNDLKPTGVGVVGLTPPLAVTDVGAAAIHDLNGHGSFCAGLLSGRNEQFVVGMAPASDLLVIKVTSDGSFGRDGLEVIFAGIQLALDNGAEIISIGQSLVAEDLNDTPGYIDQMQQRLNAMLAGKNVLVFAACGDNISGEMLTAERYPASLDGCISVGATDQGQLSDIAVRSKKTIIHAQGIGISSYLLGDSPEQRSGTSYSTSIVAGIAALAVSKLKRRHGSWDAGTLLNVLADGDPIVGQEGRTLISPTRIFQHPIFQ
jgi:subtilisin family serine protease